MSEADSDEWRHSSRPLAGKSMDIRIECSAVYTLLCTFIISARDSNHKSLNCRTFYANHRPFND